MSEIISKIVKSKIKPNTKDVLWDNGKELKIFRNGEWIDIGLSPEVKSRVDALLEAAPEDFDTLKEIADSIKGMEIPTKVSQLENDSKYLTSIPSEYITESELTAKKYLTSIPSEYVTESELTAKGYTTNVGTITGIKMNGVSKGTSGVVDLGTVITAHQSLDGYAKTTDITTLQTTVNSQATEITTLQETITTLQTTIAGFEERIAALEGAGA